MGADLVFKFTAKMSNTQRIFLFFLLSAEGPKSNIQNPFFLRRSTYKEFVQSAFYAFGKAARHLHVISNDSRSQAFDNLGRFFSQHGAGFAGLFKRRNPAFDPGADI